MVAVLLFLVGSFACSHDRQPNEKQAAVFIQTYYLDIDPKSALEITEGPAREKMLREVELLEGVGRPQKWETPAMTYQIKDCQLPEPGKAQCTYEIDIDAGRRILRKGMLTLRKEKDGWKATQFIETEQEILGQ